MKHHRITHGSAGLCFTCSFGLSSTGGGGSLGLFLFLDFLAFLRLAFFVLPVDLLVDFVGLVLLDGGRSVGGSKAEDHELASSGSSS